jgi:hypothetical protein
VPTILDPLTYLNASKSSFKIKEVQSSFSWALDCLLQYKFKFDKMEYKDNKNINIAYDLLLSAKK